MTPADQIARGAKAKKLLEDPLLLEAFTLSEQAILNKFRTAREDSDVIRAKQLLTALTLVRRVLEEAITDGKVAERSLDEQKRGTTHFLGDIWQSRRKR